MMLESVPSPIESPSPHLTRKRYPEVRDALADAERVADDLVVAVDGQLVVPVADVDFLIRRLRLLVRSCAEVFDAEEHAC